MIRYSTLTRSGSIGRYVTYCHVTFKLFRSMSTISMLIPTQQNRMSSYCEPIRYRYVRSSIGTLGLGLGLDCKGWFTSIPTSGNRM